MRVFRLKNILQCFVVNQKFFLCLENKIPNVTVIAFTVLFADAVYRLVK